MWLVNRNLVVHCIDFDHPGSEFRQHLGAEGACNSQTQVEYQDPFQRR